MAGGAKQSLHPVDRHAFGSQCNKYFMNTQEAIQALINRKDLSKAQMTDVMQDIMTGKATDAQIGGFLVALNMKGETVEEITAAAAVMRELSAKVDLPIEGLVDTCGTGGDASGLFNVSTAAAIVVAAAGGRVAKHGNRAASSKSGSADVLEAAGVKLELTAEQVVACVEKVGVGFMFAPQHHSAMKHAIGPRKEMAIRTVFNFLGPLTNPAGAPNQVMGVFDKKWVEPLAEVLQALGSQNVMVVHSNDGLDEVSIAAPTYVAELRDGKITTYTVQPEELGIDRSSLDKLKVKSAEQSLSLIQQALAGESGAAADIIAANAGAALYVLGISKTWVEGVAKARGVLKDGKAAVTLRKLIDTSKALTV